MHYMPPGLSGLVVGGDPTNRTKNDLFLVDPCLLGCSVSLSPYAFLSKRVIQIRKMAPMIATTIVPIKPPA